VDLLRGAASVAFLETLGLDLIRGFDSLALVQADVLLCEP